MKKISLICLALLTALSCRQEELSPICRAEACGATFSAVIEGGGMITRTVLGEDLSSVWSSGDRIGIFSGSSAMDEYQVEDECAGYSKGIFNILEDGGDGTELSVNIAVYPYQESLTCAAYQTVDGAPISYQVSDFSFPAIQKYQNDSFAADSYAMVAVTSDASDYNLTFRNLGGALKVLLTGDDVIKTLTLKGNGGEAISGNARIQVYTDGNLPEVSMTESAGTSITLDCGSGVQLNETEPTAFIFSMPPTSFEEGFTIEMENVEGGKGKLYTTQTNAIERSKILKMPAVAAAVNPPLKNRSYVDEYGVNRGCGVLIDGIVWAPVNCGYKGSSSAGRGYPYGKMYQWGRSHGDGYSLSYDMSIPNKTAGGSVAIADANAESGEGVFYTRTDGNNLSNWFSDTEYSATWNAGTPDAPVKSANDPCPDGWRVPTKNELQTLVANRSSWVTVGSQNGYWFSGSVEYTDGVTAVFLPATGWISHAGAGTSRGSYGRYWASSVYEPAGTIYHLMFYNTGSVVPLTGSVLGCALRCVADADYEGNTEDGVVGVSSIILNKTEMTMTEGEICQLKAEIYPSEASAEFVTWTSSDESVLYVDQYGNVYAYAAGEAEITVSSGTVTASCDITVTEYVAALIDYVDEYDVNHGTGVRIDGIIWAPVNCGFLESSDTENGYPYGKLYQWGRPHGFGYSTSYDSTVPDLLEGPMADYGNFDGYYSVVDCEDEDYSNTFITVSDTDVDWFEMPDWDGEEEWQRSTFWNWGTSDEPEKSGYDPCPDGWRLPTYNELSLLNSNHSTFTVYNGQNGFWYSGSTVYADGVTSVFLPAAGFINHKGETAVREQGGRYWVSDLSEAGVNCTLYFFRIDSSETESSSMGGCGTAQACSVRCVQEQ